MSTVEHPQSDSSIEKHRDDLELLAESDLPCAGLAQALLEVNDL